MILDSSLLTLGAARKHFGQSCLGNKEGKETRRRVDMANQCLITINSVFKIRKFHKHNKVVLGYQTPRLS